MGNALLSGQSSCFYGTDDDDSHQPALLSCLAAESDDRWSPTQVRSVRGTLDGEAHWLPERRVRGARWGFQHRATNFVGIFPQSEHEAASTSLLVAAFNGREDKVRDLLSRTGTNPNISYSNGNTPLIIAVQENHTRVINQLLNRPDILVNLRGLDGYTALIRACYERSDIVKILLNRKDIDVNLSTYYGTTALTYAIRNGNLMAVNELIQHPRININYQSKHGENALFEAVSYKRKDIVDILLENPNCSVDIVDQHDRTPFLVACQYGFEDIAVVLIAHGCDTTVEDDCGRNGLYHAVKRNREIVIHTMLDRREPYSLKSQCRTVLRSYVRSLMGPGESVRRVIKRIPKHELPRTLIQYLTFEH